MTKVLPITESSQASQARRIAGTLASETGLNDSRSGEVQLVVTELAKNLDKHATGGEILLRVMEHKEDRGIEILAIDGGPGMTEIAECLRDGYSTAGSPGTGLGAVRRISSEFEIYSLPGSGTAVLSRIWAGKAPAVPAGNLEIGAVCAALPGETQCGDAWAYRPAAHGGTFVVADGLGHGEKASVASQKFIEVFHENHDMGLTGIIQEAHVAMRRTRGAAVLLVDANPEEETVNTAGIGNIEGTILFNGDRKGIVSRNGTVGHALTSVHELSYPFPKRSLLVLHSDGLQSRWNFSSYPGLRLKDPSLIAAVLYRDFRRGNDDVTVVVARVKE
ncbi:MAG: SpoIIE family protein phosphatase [Planctomycetota bacterium]|jgi:anti-sigma regulatory factor (Ser/Thr protein kinase)|nr:SpoIIE family protein phosphatase [Planctomycetota bacterium]